jgi:hypothetical protein
MSTIRHLHVVQKIDKKHQLQVALTVCQFVSHASLVHTVKKLTKVSWYFAIQTYCDSNLISTF